jgi:transcriptional regulator GlxA family with amidase domain
VYDYEIVSNQPGTVFEAEGLRIVVDKPCYDIRGDVDTVVFPAIDYEGKCLRDQRFIAWIRRISKRARRVVTVCIGTYLLAEAGVLDGRRAATHWGAGRDFRRRYPHVILDTEPIYVKDGNLYTSAGVTSILDLMVALIEEDFGSELALRVAQGMVMFLRRPANQSQFSVPLTGLKTDDERIRDVVSHIAKNPGSDLSVERLGEVAGMSPRTFTRVFAREIGMTPGKFVELSRLESARRFLEQSTMPVGEIARACGYSTMDGMRLAFDRNLGVTPRESVAIRQSEHKPASRCRPRPASLCGQSEGRRDLERRACYTANTAEAQIRAAGALDRPPVHDEGAGDPWARRKSARGKGLLIRANATKDRHRVLIESSSSARVASVPNRLIRMTWTAARRSRPDVTAGTNERPDARGSAVQLGKVNVSKRSSRALSR